MFGCLITPSLFSQQSAPAGEFEAAKQLVMAGKPAEAIEIYDRLFRAYPDNPELLFSLCVAEFKAQRYHSAVQHARALLQLKPDLALAHLFLGAGYLELGQPANAVDPLEKAVDALPGDRNARLMFAEALLRSKRYVEALGQLQITAELLPENPRVWYGLGQTYDALADLASHELQTTAPDSSYWFVLAGDSYLKQRRFGSAFAAYQEALSKGPALPETHAGLARLYKEIGHSDWSAREEALETNMPPAQKSGEAAACYFSYKSYREMAAGAYRHLTQFPSSVENHLHQAAVLDAEGRHREATSEWREALKAAPVNLEAVLGLARSLYESRDYDLVLPILAKLLNENPDSVEANFLYGASLLNLQQPENAIPYLKAALGRDPQMRAAMAALGQALLHTGKPEQAIPYLKTATDFDEDGNAHFQLFRAYQLTDNRSLAEQALTAYTRFRASLDEQRRIEDGLRIAGPSH